MKILLASHTQIGGTFVVGSHHLSRAFAESGHEVLHLAAPVTPLHMLQWQDPGIRERFRALGTEAVEGATGLRQVIPFALIPRGLTSPFGRRRNLTLGTMVPSLRSTLARAGFAHVDLVLIDKPLFCGIWNYTDCGTIIYRPTDLYSAMRGQSRLVDLERRILARVDGVVSTSRPVDEHVQSLLDRPVPRMVLENGVEYEHFSTPAPPPPEYERIPEPRAIYIGAMDQRFDWDAVTAAARELPDVQFVLVGPARDDRRGSLDNLHLLGTRPYSRLPGYLQHATVGLLPLSDHPANEGRSPMKLYEYMAAGIGVVARTTRELAQREAPGVRLYATGTDFPRALRDYLRAPLRPPQVRPLAQPYSWSCRSRELLSFASRL